MRELARRSFAVVLITDKLAEAFEFGDRITVLRQGRKVAGAGTGTAREEDVETFTGEVIHGMFGGAGGDMPPPVAACAARLCWWSAGLYRRASVSFEVAAGEILGIAGIDGNGKRCLPRRWRASGGLRAAISFSTTGRLPGSTLAPADDWGCAM